MKNRFITGLLAAVLSVSLSGIMALPANAGTSTYTLDADFDQGTLVNVNHDSPNNDQLQLDETVEPFDFIWVAVSSRGTAVKIDTNTGAVLGEYLTSPSGNGNPSRTTVDNNGNVWVANRNNVGPTGKGTVIHIASIPAGSTTSSGLGDVLAWGTDDAVLHYVEVNSTGTRHLSVDANNDVWVSGTSNRVFDLVNGSTGAIIRSEPSVGYGGYGGLIDGNGVIWSARNLLRWDTANPLTGPTGGNWDGYGHDSYGLGIDSSGNVWNSQLSGNLVHKFAPNGVLLGSYGHGAPYRAQGVVAGLNDHIWVAHALDAGQDTVGHILNDGTFVGNVDLEPGTVNANVGPTGVAVDANGKIWATGYLNGKVYRIDPTGGAIGGGGAYIGAVDLTVTIGGNLYNYSDMTGSTLTAPPNSGSWTVVNDSGIPGAPWTTISWNAVEPGDSSIAVSVASSADGVAFGPLQSVSNGQDMQTVPVPDGQYLKIVVSFTRSNTSGKDSPILEDLTVANNNPPTADANGPYTVDEGSPVTLDGSGSSDPDGDVVNYEWDLDYDGQFDDATGVTAFVTYDDNGLYTVGLKVTDPFGESDTDDAIVTVNNVAPTVGPITAPAAPVGVGTPINASAGFTDPGTADTHTAVWDWGDGTTPGTVTQGAGSGSVADSHTYSAAGIYTIVLTVTDDDGGVGQSTFQYVVVYDPSAGFVTGGGWIDSPAGAYKPDPNLEGKANFGFVAKYKKGKSTPDGNTEFQFHAGDLNFHSSSYDWLVVTGSDYAMFKGLGTINGMGEYKFRIWAGDDAPDTFRIKIWTEDGA
ncbi:MAG: PKD domain-containing protein, partial [Planctomycetota bacterium]